MLTSFSSIESSSNPIFGTRVDWGECQWLGGCGETAHGTQIGTEYVYIFWIPIKNGVHNRKCTPQNTPCDAQDELEEQPIN